MKFPLAARLAWWVALLCLLSCHRQAQAEVRRFRVQLEIQRQGVEKVEQRSYWLEELVPRTLEMEGLPFATEVRLAAQVQPRTPNVVLVFVVTPSPAVDYQELTPSRLVLAPDSPPAAFCFALNGQVFRINVTGLKVQVLE